MVKPHHYVATFMALLCTTQSMTVTVESTSMLASDVLVELQAPVGTQTRELLLQSNLTLATTNWMHSGAALFTDLGNGSFRATISPGLNASFNFYRIQLDNSLAVHSDVFEPNDSFVNGITLFDPVLEDLSIHSSSDEDYFEIFLLSGETITCTIGFTHELGDLDLQLYSSEPILELVRSESVSDNESIVYSNTSDVGGLFLIRIWGFDGAINNYQLSITVE